MIVMSLSSSTKDCSVEIGLYCTHCSQNSDSKADFHPSSRLLSGIEGHSTLAAQIAGAAGAHKLCFVGQQGAAHMPGRGLCGRPGALLLHHGGFLLAHHSHLESRPNLDAIAKPTKL